MLRFLVGAQNTTSSLQSRIGVCPLVLAFQKKPSTVFGRMKVKSTSSWNTMISMHMQCKRFDLALAQFEEMTDRDIVTWNSMISGYNQHGFDIEALDMFSNMLKDPLLKPDKYTLSSVLSACANLNEVNSGKQIEIALLDGYIKQGDMNPARKIFDSLRDRDVVAWTAMIVGYMQNGFNNEAMDLFRSMIKEGPQPNSYTLAAILSVSSSLASLDHGKQIHARAIKSEYTPSVSVSNALINMYAKSGNISNAKHVFDMISCLKDTVSWTSMVISLAQHGFGAESLELFERMLSFDIKPDHITYVGVISACTHMGLVKEGREYFKLMQEKHRIEPTPSHYACMIDLLGRAGKLEEAWHFIKNMPIEPDVIGWGSLLASSFVHKNMDLAKVAAEKLLLIDPDNSGAYSALANVYSACGKWDNAAEIRKSMKSKQVKKEQGFSWVQIRNQVHVFGADDNVHPDRDEIYQNMAEIWKGIKKLGFVPKTEAVLHDLDEEVKEEILMHHSEKLAIAYALMKSPKNSTLRIMKNLRTVHAHVEITGSLGIKILHNASTSGRLPWYARAYPAYKVDPPLADPKEGEIRVKNKAIGVNFVDIYHRTGVYKVPEIPCTPGVEAVGVVTAIGPGVNDLKVGDMVYHSGSGTYTEEKIVLADKAMPLPPIDPLIVASVVGKGLTAHFLVKSWFKTAIPLLKVERLLPVCNTLKNVSQRKYVWGRYFIIQ
ncbi:pentatricopeptide repeat-containing protein [Tanacetum coccineum]